MPDKVFASRAIAFRLRRHQRIAAWRMLSRAVALAAFVGCIQAAQAQRPLLAEPALARRLGERLSISWEGQALRDALERLAGLQRLPLWLDRRIDPAAVVTLTVDGADVADVLDRLTADESRDWGWTTLRTVVYFGPRQTADELATLSQRARQSLTGAPNDVRRKWLTPGPWEYPRLSEPRTLWTEIVASVDAELRPGAAIPHDLWPARELPSIAPVDRAVLLLAGFDLALEASADGRHVRATPIKGPAQIAATYPRNTAVESAIEGLQRADARVRVKRQGRRIAVSARWEDHERLRAAQRGESQGDGATDATLDAAPAAAGGQQRYTLKIENQPLGRIVDQLAAKLQLAVTWDPTIDAKGEGRATLVSCDVREADVDELLRAILTPARLTFERDGQSVTIRPGS